MIYLDHSSATFIEDEVLDTFVKVEKKYFGNADALHSFGMEVQKLQESSRIKVAQMLGVQSSEIIFTSGGCESNSLAICGVIQQYQHRKNHVLYACGEHSSVKKALQHFKDIELEEIPLDKNGNIDLDVLTSLIKENTLLVSIAGINNELGSIRCIDEIGKFLKSKNVIFHVDAVQLIGKEKFDFSNVDLVSISGHKIHGIKGIGVLVKKDHIKLQPIIFGGQQEFGLRGGTSSIGLQVSFVKALRLAIEHQDLYKQHIYQLNQYLRKQLTLLEDVEININEHVTDYILNFSVKSLPSQVLLNAFSKKEIYVSAVSTCVSKQKATSNLSCITNDQKRLQGVIRVSLSYRNTIEELKIFVDTLKDILTQYKK